MTTLHVLSHSPFADNRLESCLRVLGKDDGLLLSGDAVYALQSGTQTAEKVEKLSAAGVLFALEEDVRARNISPQQSVELVDYTGFVALSCQFDKVNSWL